MGKKNDLYNEITRLKAENEKLMEKLAQYTGAQADIIDVEPIEPGQEEAPKQKLDKESSDILELAKKYAAKLGLDEKDVEEMKDELLAADEKQKQKYRNIIESTVVQKSASDRLSEIMSMEMQGKSPKQILSKLYEHDEANKKETQFVDKLAAKLRLNNQVGVSALFGNYF